ncbi:MAG: glycosyltransferase family 4 protein [Planctomycetota bacterium]|nr:glycosyltransferase family 4 protein [Planctomycetota bacterium]
MALRVLQLLQRPQRRGAEIFAAQLCRWLQRQGHRTRSAYLYPNEGEGLELEPEDVLLGGNEHSPLERLPGLHPGLLRRLRSVVADFSPDIIQVNGARTVKYGAGLRLGSPRRRWRIVYRNIDSPRFWVRGALRRALYRNFVMPSVDGVVGVSRRTLAEVQELYGVSAPRVYIPNGVDLEALRPGRTRDQVRASLHTPHDAFVAIFIGSLGRQKRPDRFLEVIAAASRRNNSIVGWLLGDGPDRAWLEARAGNLQIEDRTRFLGYQAHVADYIAAADAYVCTSDTEGIPAVVVETGYFGLPTLGSAVGGMPECVLDGHTGHLYPPEAVGLFVDGLVRLADRPEERAELGQRAREWTLKNFSMRVVGSEYQQFYERVLAT